MIYFTVYDKLTYTKLKETGIIMNLNFAKAPGYVLDLLYVFCLNFNDEENYKNAFLMYDGVFDRTKISDIKKHFGNIRQELQIFFAMKQNGRCFMTTCYFSKYAYLMSDKYNFDFMISELENHEQLIDRLITFYFPELEGKEGEYRGCLDKLSPIIDNSNYSEIVKRKLYSFFVNPQHAIEQLIYELKSKEELLSRYYGDNSQLILETTDKIFNNYSVISEICAHLNISVSDDISPYISLCLLNQNCLWAYGDKSLDILIVGFNYENVLSYYKNSPQVSDLCAFGDIFSEKNRIEILRFMKERGEITIKDLEKQLSFTGSTAYYHLTMMLRENMIIARNQGRTVLYSINSRYFKSVIDQINSFL